jgi:hypothetical protein
MRIFGCMRPRNRLRFPSNRRWLMRSGPALYNPNEWFRPREDRSPEWNRGAYLVEALARSGECRTPRNLAQTLDNRHKFEARSLMAGAPTTSRQKGRCET